MLIHEADVHTVDVFAMNMTRNKGSTCYLTFELADSSRSSDEVVGGLQGFFQSRLRSAMASITNHEDIL